MRKALVFQKINIVICVLLTGLLLSSCKYAVPEDKRVDVISEIAEIVNDNYSCEDVETPYQISMSDIDELADESGYLHKAFGKYSDVQQYKVFLLDNNAVLVVTDVIFQKVEGYVVSDEVLEHTLPVPNLGYDADRIGIVDRIEGTNIYTCSAGL